MTVGWAALKAGDLDKALQHFDRAIRLAPELAEAHYARGVNLCMRGRHQQAIAAIDRCLELRPDHARALTERGLARVATNDIAGAINDYERALDLDPTYSVTYINYGGLLIRQSRLEEALNIFNWAIRLDPALPAAYLMRAQVLKNLGRPHQALADIDATMKHRLDERYLSLAGQLRLDLRREAQHTAPPPPPSWRDSLWPNVARVTKGATVAELVAAMDDKRAHHAALVDQQGEFLLADGQKLRAHLTDVADKIGPAILTLKVDQFPDLWHPCLTLTPQTLQEQAATDKILVVEDGQILGYWPPPKGSTQPRLDKDAILSLPSLTATPVLPLARLFGKQQLFLRGESERSCRRCLACFAYYRPLLSGDLLAGYACPDCSTDAVEDWVAARMQPKAWSQQGFLGEGDDIREVIARDARRLEALEVTAAQVGAVLERLLDAAIDAWERDPTGQMPLMLALKTLQSGSMPPEDSAFCEGNLQIFFTVFMGYQDCPFTALVRPYCDETLGTPLRIYVGQELPKHLRGLVKAGEDLNKQTSLVTVTGLSRRCHGDVSYRGADRDFLILNRATGEHVTGPGLIAHLIRSHRFFEGPHSPYRVEPERLVRVLASVLRPG